jgi:hypothetical protein
MMAGPEKDLDLVRGELRVERSLGLEREIDTPKSGHGRTVDVSQGLRLVLRRPGRGRARPRSTRRDLSRMGVPGERRERAHAARHGPRRVQANAEGG